MRRSTATHHRFLLPFLLAAGLSFGATAATGLQPSTLRSIPDGAFVPITIDATAVDARGEPRTHVSARAAGARPTADPVSLLGDTPERPRPSLPSIRPIVVNQPVAVPKATFRHSISGRASWYCDAGVSPCSSSHPDTTSFDAYAAAGPRLRAAIGADWRGSIVVVDGIRVKLIDWCQCYQGEPNEKLLDLYHDVYLRTGSSVTIRW